MPGDSYQETNASCLNGDYRETLDSMVERLVVVGDGSLQFGWGL
jgi:hypothetical protein